MGRSLARAVAARLHAPPPAPAGRLDRWLGPRRGEDLRRLLAECHKRGIRVIVDIVPNHSSDRHPAFRAALATGETVAEWRADGEASEDRRRRVERLHEIREGAEDRVFLPHWIENPNPAPDEEEAIA